MATLKLRAELYDRSAIDQAVRAFEQIAAIDVSREGGYYIGVFDSCAYDEARTMREFENYLIDYLNSLPS